MIYDILQLYLLAQREPVFDIHVEEVRAVGRLTTHVLDLALGRPARGLKVELRRLDVGHSRVPEASTGSDAGHGAGSSQVIRTTVTNADGRLDSPLLEGAEMVKGVYELLFYAGDYLRAQGHPLPDPPFLDEIPIRFSIAAPQSHYHVPLLLSPWGYSTYRGS